MLIINLISISVLIGLLFNITPFSIRFSKLDKKVYIISRIFIFFYALLFLSAFYSGFFSNFDDLNVIKLSKHNLTVEKVLYVFLCSNLIFAYFFRTLFSSLLVPKKADIYINNLRIFIVIIALSLNIISEIFPYVFSEKYAPLINISNKVLTTFIIIDLLLITLFKKYKRQIIKVLFTIKKHYLRDTILTLSPFIVIWICTLINLTIS